MKRACGGLTRAWVLACLLTSSLAFAVENLPPEKAGLNRPTLTVIRDHLTLNLMAPTQDFVFRDGYPGIGYRSTLKIDAYSMVFTKDGATLLAPTLRARDTIT